MSFRRRNTTPIAKQEATKALQELDWRLYDLVISPVPRLEEPQQLAEEQPRE